MVLVISRFTVANAMEQQVCDAFENRPRQVEDAPGFVRLEVHRPVEDPSEFWLMTWWTDEKSFRAWHRSHAYRSSHQGIPKGLRLDPRRTEIRMFEPVAR